MARTGLNLNAVENMLEITRFQKSMTLCQPEVQNFLPARTIDNQASRESRSGGQTSPAFCPAAGQYLAAFFGGHTGTETVGACALDKTGLKCTFHGNSWNDVNTVIKLLTRFHESVSRAGGRKKEGGFYTLCQGEAIQFRCCALVTPDIWLTQFTHMLSTDDAQRGKKIFCQANYRQAHKPLNCPT